VSADAAPRLNGVLETALYVADMAPARAFYEQVLGLTSMTADARLCAYGIGPGSVLLLFQKGTTLETVRLPGGTIPPHDGGGPAHLAFAIAAADLAAWERRLAAADIAIEGRTEWPRGGISLYVRDPDGHLVEFATPGLWAVY
jgi:catechol 2,3-dioxygenase-like lactoylglutathione lyase family enzyme